MTKLVRTASNNKKALSEHLRILSVIEVRELLSMDFLSLVGTETSILCHVFERLSSEEITTYHLIFTIS